MERRVSNYIIAWAYLIEGVCGVLTFGLWQPPITLEVVKRCMKWRYRRGKL